MSRQLRLFSEADLAAEPSPATRKAAKGLASALASSELAGLVVPGGPEGILTGVGAIFLAHAHVADPPVNLQVEGSAQPLLGEQTLACAADEPFARRVLAGFAKATSDMDAKRIVYACLSDDPGRAGAVLACMRQGFALRRRLLDLQANPAVAPVIDLAHYVACECEYTRQFVRFHKMPNGVYRARFEPKANVIGLVAGHFITRFNTQPFVIHDPRHKVAVLWDGRTSAFVQADDLPDFSSAQAADDDRYYHALWKAFFDHTAIEARANPKLQRHYMPKRFWANLEETQGL